MNKSRSKKYLYWQIPDPPFSPKERNRILKLLFKAYEAGEFEELNDLIREGIHEISYPYYRKRPNGKYFDRITHNFAKNDKHVTLYKYCYRKNVCYALDKEDERIEKKIFKKKGKIEAYECRFI